MTATAEKTEGTDRGKADDVSVCYLHASTIFAQDNHAGRESIFLTMFSLNKKKKTIDTVFVHVFTLNLYGAF